MSAAQEQFNTIEGTVAAFADPNQTSMQLRLQGSVEGGVIVRDRICYVCTGSTLGPLFWEAGWDSRLAESGLLRRFLRAFGVEASEWCGCHGIAWVCRLLEEDVRFFAGM